MPKIKLPNHNDLLDETLDIYKVIHSTLSESLKERLLCIQPLLSNGILTESAYDLFNESSFELSMPMFSLRQIYIKKFGYFLVSEDFLKNAIELFSKNKILEVGSGSGFLSSCLQSYGLDITPTDENLKSNPYGFTDTYTDIIETDSVQYLKNNVKNFDTVLMSWPNYDTDFAYNILKNMKKGQTLIYIGEGYGGCTGNDQFFDRLDSHAILMEKETDKMDKASFQWFGLHDRVSVYKIIK